MKKFFILLSCTLCLLILFTACKCKHTWNDATCTTPKTCTICSSTEGEPLGHKWTVATCTQSKKCSTCGEIDGEPLGHVFVEATCEKSKYCSVCNYEVGKPAEHSTTDWSTIKAPTCSTLGKAESSCTACGKTFSKDIPKLEHNIGDWVITKNATFESAGTRTKSCSSCGEVVMTTSYELSEAEKEPLFKAACKTYSYKEIARQPDAYKGNYAKFKGEVIQVTQSESQGYLVYILRVNVTKQGSYSTYYTDTVFVTYVTSPNASRILDDDIITMYGVLEGEKTYTSVLGSSITIPAFTAKYIDIHY